MIKKLSYLVSGIILSLNLAYADHDGYEYARTFLDLNDTLSGVVEVNQDVGKALPTELLLLLTVMSG
jgi:hypothetical protein